MAYLKLWIDPSIITNNQIQLPNKVAVGTNPDDSNKYNLTITRGDSLNSSPWAEEARFLLTPDPEIGHMPVKTNEGLKYLLVESDFIGYNNYWTYYATTKLWLNVLEDSYGKFIRFGSNTPITDYWRTLAQTYKEDGQGNKDYYLFPECGIDRGYGQYWHYPSPTFIRSIIERNFDTIQEQSNVSYINNSGERISRYPYTGVQEAICIDTETEGGAVCITTRINIGVGSTSIFQVATASTANVVSFTINRSEDNKYTITVPYPRDAENISGGTTREIPNFDPNIPHRYVFIHRPNKVLEVWVDHVQYKKEDGSDIYYQRNTVYGSYDWTSYIWGFNKAYSDGNPVEDLYEFKLYQGELKYEDTIDLTASITASRNPVTTNVPDLSTSELTCHVDGVLDRDNDKYKKYIEHDWGEVDFSVFPPRLLYADGDILAPAVSDLQYAEGKHITIDGDDCLKVTGLINFPNGYNNPLYKCTPINNIQVEFDYKYEAMSSGNYISSSPYASIYTLPYYTGGIYNSCGIHLHYVASVGKYVICVANGGLYGAMSDYLDIDFTKWHTFKIVIVTNPVETNKSIAKIYIDGTYIPFHDNDYNKVYDTDIISTPDYSGSVFRNYWHYTFNSYASWHEGQIIYYKNYKIKTLTFNNDYEEYPELTYLWNTGETTKQITVQPTEPTEYTCTVTQGSRTANASILIDTTLKKDKPIAVISPQEKPYIEHMIGRFYATNSYDINDPVSPIVKYIWNGVESVSPIFTTRVKKTDIITLQVVNALGLVSDEVQVDLSQEYDQWGNKYKFLDIPMFLVCSKGSSIYDTLISRFPISTNANDLYTSRYDTEYPEYTNIGFTTDISSDTITYMACLPQYGVAEYKAPKDKLDIYPLGISWLEKRNMLKYFDKTKNSKGSLLACIGHPELGEEGYGSLEWVLNSLGILTPKERYSIPRLLDLLELLLMDYENGGLIKL